MGWTDITTTTKARTAHQKYNVIHAYNLFIFSSHTKKVGEINFNNIFFLI